ncbi:MAG: hypothetical protein GTN69_08650 [Armatimonadetes bacterium]|nr:hypothetical protein [Armatimonadota bacterium]NIO75933.1 hypothetical protein [Armatimonadota bacterium]NIO98745.1 hypothetical protein [Armatimonadota bacterium]
MKGLHYGVVLILLVVISILLFTAGCGEKDTSSQTTPAVSDSSKPTPLPDWAPENPSPEFLRAAKVLKPFPPELLRGAAEAGKTSEGVLLRFIRTWEASYELFGTMSDEQIERLRSTGEIRMPVRALTTQQRSALDNWFETWRSAMEGGPLDLQDYLVELYKCGAKEDLSNVEFGFATPEGSGRMVHVKFWVKQRDGSIITRVAEFAYI